MINTALAADARIGSQKAVSTELPLCMKTLKSFLSAAPWPLEEYRA